MEAQTIIWNRTLRLVKEFRKRYGRLPTAKDKYRGISLGVWLDSQDKLLTGYDGKKKKDKLRRLGWMLSPVKKVDKVWSDKFEILKSFMELYKREPTLVDTHEDIQIGAWLFCQKAKCRQGKRTPQQVNLLMGLNIDLGYARGSRWATNYDSCRKFFILNKRLPNVRDNQQLYKWIENQRASHLNEELSDDRTSLIREIGIISMLGQTPNKNESIRDVKWNENYDLSLKFFTENGRSVGINDDQRLHYWARKQKRNYRDNRLSDEKVKLLKDAGIIKDARNIAALNQSLINNASFRDMRWNESYDLSLKFFTENGRPISKHDNGTLHNWATKQKRNYCENRLSDERVKLLKDAGIIELPGQKLDRPRVTSVANKITRKFDTFMAATIRISESDERELREITRTIMNQRRSTKVKGRERITSNTILRALISNFLTHSNKLDFSSIDNEEALTVKLSELFSQKDAKKAA